MKIIKSIYSLLRHSDGLKIKEIANKLDLDEHYVANIMLSSVYSSYWYENYRSLWFAKKDALRTTAKIIYSLPQNEVIKITTNKENRKFHSILIESQRYYLNSFFKYHSFSKKETKNLFERYRRGDRSAYDLLIKSYLWLIPSIANLHRDKETEFEDLLQEGVIGLIKAFELYNAKERKRDFRPYAEYFIYQHLATVINNHSNTLRSPINQISFNAKIHRMIQRNENDFGHMPRIDYEVSISNKDDGTNYNIYNLQYLYNITDDIPNTSILLDDLVNIADESFRADERIEKEDLHTEIQRCLNCLDPRKRDILKMYFGIDTPRNREYSLEEIGEKYDLTRERIRQIKEKALRQLKTIIKKKKLALQPSRITKSKPSIKKTIIKDSLPIFNRHLPVQFNKNAKSNSKVNNELKCLFVLNINDLLESNGIIIPNESSQTLIDFIGFLYPDKNYNVNVHFGQFIFHSRLVHSINTINNKYIYSINWRNSISVNNCLKQQAIHLKQQEFGFYAKKGSFSFYLKPIKKNKNKKITTKQTTQTKTKREEKNLQSNKKKFLFSVKLSSSFASRSFDIPETAFLELSSIIGYRLPRELYQDITIEINKQIFNARLEHIYFLNSSRDSYKISWLRQSKITRFFRTLISSTDSYTINVYGLVKKSHFILEPIINKHNKNLYTQNPITTSKIKEDNRVLITLSHEIIEKARTPNGGFTKSQLAAIGVGWPPPEDWIKEKIGTKITKEQLEGFNKIEYAKPSSKSLLRISKKSESSYKDVARNKVERQQMIAILQVLLRYEVPASAYDIARAISRSSWGESTFNYQVVESLLKRLPEVAHINNDKYILKRHLNIDERTKVDNQRIKLSFSNSRTEILSHYEALKRVVQLVGTYKVNNLGISIKNNPLLQKIKPYGTIKYEEIAAGWWLNSEVDAKHCFNSINFILNHYNIGVKAELV